MYVCLFMCVGVSVCAGAYTCVSMDVEAQPTLDVFLEVLYFIY